jgi:Ca2+-transporting ATPase
MLPGEEQRNVELWRVSTEDLARRVEVDADRGLAAEEARRRLNSQGANELPESPPPSLLSLFLSQFTSVIVWVLIGAAVISGLLETAGSISA